MKRPIIALICFLIFFPVILTHSQEIHLAPVDNYFWISPRQCLRTILATVDGTNFVTITVYDTTGFRGFEIVYDIETFAVYAVEREDARGETISDCKETPEIYKFYRIGTGEFDKLGVFRISLPVAAGLSVYPRKSFIPWVKVYNEIRLNLADVLEKPDFVFPLNE